MTDPLYLFLGLFILIMRILPWLPREVAGLNIVGSKFELPRRRVSCGNITGHCMADILTSHAIIPFPFIPFCDRPKFKEAAVDN